MYVSLFTVFFLLILFSPSLLPHFLLSRSLYVCLLDWLTDFPSCSISHCLSFFKSSTVCMQNFQYSLNNFDDDLVLIYQVWNETELKAKSFYCCKVSSIKSARISIHFVCFPFVYLLRNHFLGNVIRWSGKILPLLFSFDVAV